MKKHVEVIIVIIFLIGGVASIYCFAAGGLRGGIMPGMNDPEPEERTVEDLPKNTANGKVYPISNADILYNSYEKLKSDPDNLQLEQQTIQLAKRLAYPQGPPPLAWQILVDKDVLSDGMSISKAYKILGHPTKYWHREDSFGGIGFGPSKVKKELYRVMWYYNYSGAHVAPALAADVNDFTHTLTNWEVTSH